jgi:hypothetical protein
MQLPRDHRSPYLTDSELEMLLDGSPDSRYGKVKRLLAQNQLLHIRRGLYYLKGHTSKPHPFELAQIIYAPSYISLESALAYHQLIPEAVYSITSACAKRSKEFHTPLGVFNYLHLPLENFYTEVELITEGEHQFFMAKPWKAISDYIYCYKKNWRNLQPLLESLRISREDLPPLSTQEIDRLDEYYHRRHVSRFLKNIAGELQP